MAARCARTYPVGVEGRVDGAGDGEVRPLFGQRVELLARVELEELLHADVARLESRTASTRQEVSASPQMPECARGRHRPRPYLDELPGLVGQRRPLAHPHEHVHASDRGVDVVRRRLANIRAATSQQCPRAQCC